MTKLKTILGAGVLAAAGVAGIAAAGVTAEQAARLGADLTPMGAEKAGNAAGTIPAWNGGIKSAAEAGAPGFKPGGHHPDPYANDKPLYKIDASNMSKYAASLTAGHKALLSAYKTDYFLNVYPSHRSAAFPQRIYDAVKGNATTAKLTGTGTGVTGAIGGPPFPIPQSGIEVIWNHILRYRADVAERFIGQAAVSRTGTYNLVKFHDETMVAYALPGATEAALDNVIVLLHPGDDGAGAPGGRDPPRARDARPEQGAASRLALQPGPATRAPRAERRLRQPGHRRGRAAHLRPVRPLQRQPRAL